MALSKNIPEVNRAIENILLQEYGTITSTLAKRLGQENLNDIDSLVSNTVNAARSRWSASELPNDPRNTLWQFITDNTSDLFCDKLRYRNIKRNKENFTARNLYYPDESETIENKVIMLFACCHPSLDQLSRLYLVLKILCGFSTSYIARLFLRNESSVSDQIYSAKKSIVEQKINLNVPVYNRNHRLGLIQDTLLTIFDNGMNPSNEKLKSVPELCYVSINLAKVLDSYGKTSTREIQALISMMLFKASRLGSLIDEKGNVLSLKEQDRSRWDRSMISEGLEYLQRSAGGDTISRLHLKAGVAAVHSLTPDYISTEWERIIELYDKYLRFRKEPDVQIERAIAISRAGGPREAITALDAIDQYSEIKDHKLYYMTYGNLYFRIHDYSSALYNYRNALLHVDKPNDRNFINSKIAICEQRIEMTGKYKYGLSF